MPLYEEGSPDDPQVQAQAQDQAAPMRQPMGTPEANPFDQPSINETITSAFKMANPVAALVDALSRQTNSSQQYDPSFNPIDYLRKNAPDLLENYSGSFFDTPNEATAGDLVQSIRANQRDAQTVGASGFAGTAALVAAGLTDPTFYIPIFGEFRAAAEAGVVARAARVAGEVGLQSSVSELALHAARPGEQWDASSFDNIAANTLLGGVLGGAIGYLTKPELGEAEKAFEDSRPRITPGIDGQGEVGMTYHGSAAEPVPAAAPGPGDGSGALATASVGAAQADTRDLTPVGLGVDKLPLLRDAVAAPSANLRAYFGNAGVTTKRTVADLANTWIAFEQHEKGVPTSFGGPSVDAESKTLQNSYNVAAMHILEDNWTKHYYGSEGAAGNKLANAAMLAAGREGLGAPTTADKLSFKDFDSEVYRALYSGDTHPIPEVQAAARELRAQVYDPILKEGQNIVGPDGRPMFAEAMEPPAGDPSFAPRSWSRTALAARYNQTQARITDWLLGEQSANAATRDRIVDLNEKLGALPEDALEERAAVRVQLENEVKNWRGATADEARAALRTRGVQEAERQEKIEAGAYQGAGARLTGADTAIDSAVKAILKADTDRSYQELHDRAGQIIDRMMGTPDGRIPYDEWQGGPQIGWAGGPKQDLRGAFNRRDFAIPTSLLADVVDHSALRATAAHVRTMIPDMLLTKRFGDVDLTEPMRKIQEEYRGKIDALAAKQQHVPENVQKKITDQRDKDMADVALLRDRLRGVAGWDPSPRSRGWHWFMTNAQNLVTMAALGTSVINRLVDLGTNAMHRYGFENVLADQWRPLFRAFTSKEGWTAKGALRGELLRQARDCGVACDGLLSHMRNNLYDVNNSYVPGDKFSRAVRWATDKSMVLNLHAPWTDINKALVWNIGQGFYGRAAMRVADGAPGKTDIRDLADANISPDMAVRIAKEYRAHSTEVNGSTVPNVADWTDEGARRVFMAATWRGAQAGVLTGGIGQVPNFVSRPLGSLLFQFHSFTAAAHEALAISALQRRDARALAGIFSSVALGMLSYKLYAVAAGEETSDNPADWIKEGIARSAMTGYLSDMNMLASKMTSGVLDVNRLYGATAPLTRRSEESPLADLLGPVYGRLEGLAKAGGHAAAGQFNAADIHQLRMALPLQNLMWIRSALDEAEDGLASQLGMRPRNRQPQQYAP